jgi:LmbE family N-acetylglucosaminyl deacetylase
MPVVTMSWNMSLLWIITPVSAALAVTLYLRFRSWKRIRDELKKPLPTYEISQFSIMEPSGGIWPVTREEESFSFGTTPRSDINLPKSKFHDSRRPSSFTCKRIGDGLTLTASRAVLVNGVGHRKYELKLGDKIHFDDLRIVFEGLSTVVPEQTALPSPTFSYLALPLVALVLAAFIFRDPISLPARRQRPREASIETPKTPTVETDRADPPAVEVASEIPERRVLTPDERIAAATTLPITTEGVSPASVADIAGSQVAEIDGEIPERFKRTPEERVASARAAIVQYEKWQAGAYMPVATVELITATEAIIPATTTSQTSLPVAEERRETLERPARTLNEIIASAMTRIVQNARWPAGARNLPEPLDTGSVRTESGAPDNIAASVVWKDQRELPIMGNSGAAGAGRLIATEVPDVADHERKLALARGLLIEGSVWNAGSYEKPTPASARSSSDIDATEHRMPDDALIGYSESIDTDRPGTTAGSISDIQPAPEPTAAVRIASAESIFVNESERPAGAFIAVDEVEELGYSRVARPTPRVRMTEAERLELAAADSIRSAALAMEMESIQTQETLENTAMAASTIASTAGTAGTDRIAAEYEPIVETRPSFEQPGDVDESVDTVANKSIVSEVSKSADDTGFTGIETSPDLTARSSITRAVLPSDIDAVAGSADTQSDTEAPHAVADSTIHATTVAIASISTDEPADQVASETKLANTAVTGETKWVDITPDFGMVTDESIDEQDGIDSNSRSAVAVATTNTNSIMGASVTETGLATEEGAIPKHELAASNAVPAVHPALQLNGGYVEADAVTKYAIGTVSSFGPTVEPDYFDADMMFIHAHPDDEAIDFGGFMAMMARNGRRIVTVIFTDGESGLDIFPDRFVNGEYPPRDLEGTELAKVRRAELERSLTVLGSEHYVGLGLRNNPYSGMIDLLEADEVLVDWGGKALADRLTELILGYTPEIIVSPDGPTEHALEHFEHEAVGIIVSEVIENLLHSGRADFLNAHLVSVDPNFVENFPEATRVDVNSMYADSGFSFRDIQIAALKQHITQRDAAVIAVERLEGYPFEHYLQRIWKPDMEIAHLLK